MKTGEHDITRANWNRLDKMLSVLNNAKTGETWIDVVSARPEAAREVGEYLFKGTSVPRAVRDQYFRKFDAYRRNQQVERELGQYQLDYSVWKQSFSTIGPGRRE